MAAAANMSALPKHILTATALGNVSVLTQWINDGGDPNARTIDGHTLPSVAAWLELAREMQHCISLRTRVVLHNGGRDGAVSVPVIGLGTGGPDDDPAVLEAALRAGHRLVDTGELYENEEIVRTAIAASGVPTDELFLSSKHGSLPALLQAANNCTASSSNKCQNKVSCTTMIAMFT